MNKIVLDKEGNKIINVVIHKYFPVNQYLFSTITNNKIWFSAPTSFHDQYDCNFNYDWSNVSFKEIYDKIRDIRDRNFPETSLDQVFKRAKEIYDNPNKEAEFRILITRLVGDQGISCFSERDDSLLIWSHYAEKHSGVCLTFDILKDQNFLIDHIKYIIQMITPTLIQLIVPMKLQRF